MLAGLQKCLRLSFFYRMGWHQEKESDNVLQLELFPTKTQIVFIYFFGKHKTTPIHQVFTWCVRAMIFPSFQRRMAGASWILRDLGILSRRRGTWRSGSRSWTRAFDWKAKKKKGMSTRKKNILIVGLSISIHLYVRIYIYESIWPLPFGQWFSAKMGN